MATTRRHRNTPRTALVVSDDPGLVDGVAGWLEEDGLLVMTCPGPQGPRSSCVGLRGEPCALVGIADVVLLDLRPDPDDLVLGNRRSALVEHYRSLGKEMLALVDGTDSMAMAEIAGLTFLERDSDRGQVLTSVHDLLRLGRPRPTRSPRAPVGTDPDHRLALGGVDF